MVNTTTKETVFDEDAFRQVARVGKDTVLPIGDVDSFVEGLGGEKWLKNMAGLLKEENKPKQLFAVLTRRKKQLRHQHKKVTISVSVALICYIGWYLFNIVSIGGPVDIFGRIFHPGLDYYR